VNMGGIHYAFGEDGTLNDTEIVIMNRHENQWKEVQNYDFIHKTSAVLRIGARRMPITYLLTMYLINFAYRLRPTS